VGDPLRGFDPKATYDAASTDYEDASRDFWQYMSTRTVELAAPGPGETVLDVACGNGPGLLAASRAVGPTGRVIGIDFATQMLEIAEERVRAAGAANVEVRTGDMTERPGFDIVQPWRRIGDPPTFRALAEEAGLSGFALREDVDTLTLDTPDDWWRIVIGSGLRRTAEALGEDTAAKVRARCGEAMRERGIREVGLTSQYLLATHP